MTDAPPLTCAALYDLDGTFRALVDTWVRERRCPLPLVDRCIEFGLDAAAEGARWAATEPENDVYSPQGADERGGRCGPYPTQDAGDSKEQMYWYWTTSGRGVASDVDHKRLRGTPDRFTSCLTTSLAAILWLLDNWQVTL